MVHEMHPWSATLALLQPIRYFLQEVATIHGFLTGTSIFAVKLKVQLSQLTLLKPYYLIMFQVSDLLLRSHSLGHLYSISSFLRKLMCHATKRRPLETSVFAWTLELAPSCFLLKVCSGCPRGTCLSLGNESTKLIECPALLFLVISSCSVEQ